MDGCEEKISEEKYTKITTQNRKYWLKALKNRKE